MILLVVLSAEVLVNLPLNLQAFLLVPIACFPCKTRQLLDEKQMYLCSNWGKHWLHSSLYMFLYFCKQILNQHQIITTEFQRWFLSPLRSSLFLVSPIWFSPSSLQAELWVKLFIMLGMIFLLSVPSSLGWDSFILTFAHENEMSAC